jgi:flagellar biosynthesis/type III secretory pathway chaperone
VQTQDSGTTTSASLAATSLVLDLCELLQRLNLLLEEEYQALSSQDLSRFEGIQPQKELLLERIGTIRIDEVAASLESAREQPRASGLAQLQAAWDSMQALGSTGNSLQKRNEILINRKLGVVRDALRSLQPAGHNNTPAFYDPRGRLTDKL